MTAYTPEQAKRLGVHLMNAEPRSALHGLPERSSRWKRWLPVWLVPLLGLIALSWDWARWLS